MLYDTNGLRRVSGKVSTESFPDGGSRDAMRNGTLLQFRSASQKRSLGWNAQYSEKSSRSSLLANDVIWAEAFAGTHELGVRSHLWAL
jgi:hypothetical protein